MENIVNNTNMDTSGANGSQAEPAGNTKKKAGPKREIQYYRWFFTLKYEVCTEESQLSQILKEFCKKFTFQLEKSENNYIHWQGHLSLKIKERLATLKNLIGFKEIHLEPTKNYFASENYCSKEMTKIRGPFTENSIFLKVPSPNYPWQVELLQEINVPSSDDRKIIWYVDEKGKQGKTTFAKWLAINKGASIVTNGKSADIAKMIPDDPKLIVCDYVRSLEDHINYQIIEQLKNGLVFDSKYESKMKLFNSPHVVVFSNFQPDFLKLSLDRWDIRYLHDDKTATHVDIYELAKLQANE